ncbi:nodulation protein NfeD [Deferribacter autotrophicus]|uniref:Nodulation protein NfeD n=1 Tax=Deferribacter autotrophicus TaxID=500465 RepID=A0A5A8F7R5_9BACT|nr:nodulation protein NfeD [Deferribacter autotrophicus]KAA0259489.1 nodulation protein NfeD [Deferribacter autotrophicus]
MKNRSVYIFIIFLFFITLNLYAKDVVVIDIKGIITSATTNFVKKGIVSAEKVNGILLLRIDTPGGLLSSTRNIIQLMFKSSVPVVSVVYPAGARAGSAGSFIVMASDYALMYEGSVIGAAHPVSITGKNIEGDMRKKVENDTVAFMKAIAEKRKRNVNNAVLMVTESKSFTAKEAYENGLIDGIVNSDDEIDKFLMDTFNFKSINYTFLKPTTFETIKFFLSDPNVLVFLLLITLLSLYLEIKFGGTFIFAGISIISFILFLIGLNIIPVNYFALLLFLAGIVLLIMEIFIPSFGLLALSSIVLIILGLNLLFRVNGNLGIKVAWYVIASIVLIIVILVLVIGKVIIKDYRKNPVTGAEKFKDLEGEIVYWDKGKGKVFVNGEYWDAVSDQKFKKGDKVKIKEVKGLILLVEKIKDE